MTIKELMEKTPNNIVIVDGQHKCDITQYSIFYDVFKDYVIDFVEADQNNNLLVTLKTQLIKKVAAAHPKLTATKSKHRRSDAPIL